MKVIITIPAYNEAESIGKVVSDIKKNMDNSKYKYSILVIDDGSKDGTAETARKNGAIVYSHPHNYGLAETFRTGISKCLESGADIIVHMDADGQYKADEITKLIELIEKKEADLVLGSRFKGTIEEMPLVKRLGNKAFSRVISSIINIRVSDCQTGFRAFTNEVAKKVNIISDHTYTQEQIIRAVREKFRIREVPVYFARRKSGRSRLISNPFQYAVKAWINILRIYRDYEPLKFFWRIGFTFLLFGFGIGFWLVLLFITEGKIGHIPSTILSMLLIVVGLQIIIFGFLADMKSRE